MPNHVYSHADIIGPSEVLEVIADLAQTGSSILQHYLPLPAEASETRTTTFATGKTETYSVFVGSGYETACALWGSKWADYDVELEWGSPERPFDEEYLRVRFNSAWSPVIEGYRKLSELLPIAVVLTYEEESLDYVGGAAIVGGEVLLEERFGNYAIEGYLKTKHLPAEPEWDSDEWSEWHEERVDLISELLGLCEGRTSAAIISVLGS